MIQKSGKGILIFVLSFLLLSISFPMFGQKAQGSVKEAPGKILSFEKQEDILKIKASDSDFEQSNVISMLGENSLKWDWRNGSNLSVPLYNYYSEAVRISPFKKDQCLVLWMYNEEPSAGAVTFTLGGEGLAELSCNFYLDYTGWRTAHIPLSQMEGTVPQAGDFKTYQWLEIAVPTNHPEKSGRFFIDDVYTTMMDARHPSADFQAPYVRAFFSGGTYVTQWMNQKHLPTKADLQIKQIPISKTQVKAFEQLYDNEWKEMTNSFKGKGLSAANFDRVLEQVEKLKLVQTRLDGKTYLQGPYIALKGQGLPKNIIQENSETGRFIEVKKFESILFNLVQSYQRSTDKAQKVVLKDNFILLAKAYLQSGWAAGSNMGALHHYGYSSRKIAPSFFMMKEELKTEGLLDEIAASLNWYAVAHVVNDDTHTMPDLDLFNTLLYSHYLASMMRPNKEDAARHALLLSQWMSRTFADNGQTGGFKHDGTAWHHWGHYPAYCKGAIDDAVKVANKLTFAGFPLLEEGHVALQNAVKTILLYSEGECIPRSLSGRHPLTGSHKDFIEADYTKAFINLEPIDSELMELYRYHTSQHELSGHWTLPYSALNLHRRENYLAAVRGFGMYSWGAETYNFNRFGRYQSYGTIDILYKNDKKMAYEGYDWNLNPGTTVTYLPLDELESPIPIFMLKSFSRFANGIQDKEGKNGAHGFILNESMLFNIDPEYQEIITKEKLKARKSTFFMDDIIICLGSGISGQHKTAPVYTVLTQQSSSAKGQAIVVGDQTIQQFPYERQSTGPQMLFDGKSTGFVALDKEVILKIALKEQVSRGDECTFDETRKPPRSDKNGTVNLRREPETRGTFLTAVIDHGVQPVDARYSYAILAGVNTKEFTAKAQGLLQHPELYYDIISQRNNLHAIGDVRNETETYICYEAQDLIPHSSLHAVSDPCLLIFKEGEEGRQTVSVALPDLYQSAFSREQKDKQWSSSVHELKLSFDGDWKLVNHDADVIRTEQTREKTVVVVKAQHGVSIHFELKKIRKLE